VIVGGKDGKAAAVRLSTTTALHDALSSQGTQLVAALAVSGVCHPAGLMFVLESLQAIEEGEHVGTFGIGIWREWAHGLGAPIPPSGGRQATMTGLLA